MDYLPIHQWNVEQVWERVRSSGLPVHNAYKIGMKRLSCVFCIFAPKSALMLAGKHNRELLDKYVAVEEETGYSFKTNLSLIEVRNALDRGEEPEKQQDWAM